MKRCIDCNKDFPASNEYFAIANSKSRLTPRCRLCHNERQLKYKRKKLAENLPCKLEWCRHPRYGREYCLRHINQKNLYGEIWRNKYDPNPVEINGDTAYMTVYQEEKEFKQKVIIDSEDIEKIIDFRWWASVHDAGSISIITHGPKTTLRQRIMPAEKGYVVRMKNGNTLDHRKDNLEIVAWHELSQTRKLTKANTSGVRGVSYIRRRKKWLASIKVNYKQINGGYFDEFRDAVKARRKLEKKYWNI